jgi:hypothetical protein
MIAYIVAKSEFDSELLLAVIPPELTHGSSFVSGHGLSSAVSMARTVISLRLAPVAVVIDSNSAEPEEVEARQQETEEVVGVAAPDVHLRVIVAVPELGAALFRAKALLRSEFGLRDEDFLYEIARWSTREAFEQLFSRSQGPVRTRADLLSRLRHEDIEAVREFPAIRELCDFLQEARAGRLTTAVR